MSVWFELNCDQCGHTAGRWSKEGQRYSGSWHYRRIALSEARLRKLRERGAFAGWSSHYVGKGNMRDLCPECSKTPEVP
jgi:hypothetical protein